MLRNNPLIIRAPATGTASLEPTDMDHFIRMIRRLPGLSKRADLIQLDKREKQNLMKLLNTAIMCLIKTFFPYGDIGSVCNLVAKELQKHHISSSFIDLTQKDGIVEDMIEACILLPRSSVQRRVLLSIISKHLTLSQIQVLEKERGLVFDGNFTNYIYLFWV